METLETRLQQLEQQISLLQSLVKAMGLPVDPWLSPEQAGAVLGISPTQIRVRIRKAEQLRLTKQKVDLSYGTHYRNDGDPGSGKPSWKVNLLRWQELMLVPPEKRIT